MHRLAGIAPLALASAATAGPDPGFWLVGWAPGTDSSIASGVSRDGLTAIGNSSAKKPYFSPAFMWTREGGRYDFGLLQGMPAVTAPHAISDNGMIAGEMFETEPLKRHAFRWTSGGALEDLGVLPKESRSYATGISGDGLIVVGSCEHDQSNTLGQAFRWTQQGGMVGLGFLKPQSNFSQANGISRDGTTIVGMSQTENLLSDAYRWTAGEGMVELPDLPGAPYDSSEAFAVNADGSVVVGGGTSAENGDQRAVRWANGTVENLGTILGHKFSQALAVSDDGSVVAGTVYTGSTHDAFVWTKPTGMVALADYLLSHGVEVPANYQLTEVYGVSADGMTYAGRAFNQQLKVSEGFVATIPAPPVVALLLAPCFLRRRRS